MQNDNVIAFSASAELVLVKELASARGGTSANVLRELKQWGYNIITIRMPSGQKVSAVVKLDADRYLAERAAKGFSEKTAMPMLRADTGFVYAVETDPEKRPGRIKVGWSTNFAQRLATYRTIAPNLRVVGLWRAEGQFLEQTALLLAKRNGAQVGQELFDNCEGLVAAIEAMFSLFGVPSSLDDEDAAADFEAPEAEGDQE